MNREIKFRAWDKEKKEFVYLSQSGDFGLIGDGLQFSIDLCDELFIIDQFTGLKDKNGVEIYEGDIIRTREDYVGDYFYKHEIHQVIFDDGCFCCELANLTDEFYLCEIIGNIHENPDLLK